MFLKTQKNIQSSLGLVFHPDNKNLDFCWVKKNLNNLKNKENIFECISGSCELEKFKNLENYKDFQAAKTGFVISNNLIQKFEIDLPKGCDSDLLISQQIEFVLKKEHEIDLSLNKNKWALDYLIKNHTAHVLLTEIENINARLAWIKNNKLKVVLAEPEDQALARVSQTLAHSVAMGVFEWQGF